MVADAYIHDDTVLPHQVPGDINLLFPRAEAAPEFPEVPELRDTLEASPELTEVLPVKQEEFEGAGEARRRASAWPTGDNGLRENGQ